VLAEDVPFICYAMTTILSSRLIERLFCYTKRSGIGVVIKVVIPFVFKRLSAPNVLFWF
jgi:hypothetical protein